MIIGKKACLCAVEREDLKELLDWRNRPDFRQYFREYRELNISQQEVWFTNKVMNDPNTLMFAIRDSQNKQLLGCCGLVYINWISRHADLSLYVGFENAYIDDKGLAEEACHLLIKYAFYELGLNKIWTEIYDFDTKKQNLYKKLDFHQDAILREHYFYKEQWHDSFILSLLAKDYDK
ncbi:MAG: GNAT family N-acetyltransferase [Candidatus Aureabacteria bacterium]|nr:GNAT family N-acetyltransferase [Candidatus Auribacterota bacterium]